MRAPQPGCRGGAAGDSSGRYRYRLWRRWAPGHPRLLFVLCNPSTAGACHDDPTTRRCVAFARSWGFGSVELVNLFALRTVSPACLEAACDPIGPRTDRALRAALRRADAVVAGWGVAGAHRGRDTQVAALLAAHEPACLGLTRGGHPRHPLYLPAATPLRPFVPRESTTSVPGTGFEPA